MSSKIVLIEDDHEIGEFYKECLENKGFQVTLYSNHKELAENNNEEEVDLYIVDYHLPEKNGKEILNSIKIKKPYLMVSGDPLLMTNSSARVLLKPISEEDLAFMAEAIIETELQNVSLMAKKSTKS